MRYTDCLHSQYTAGDKRSQGRSFVSNRGNGIAGSESGDRKTKLEDTPHMNAADSGAMAPPFANIVDYILGITYEIWEEKRVDRIQQYYTPQSRIYTLKGIVQGADQVERGTRKMLAAFPDRILIGDNVIWRSEANGAFYTSHRITSPMTNLGDSEFGSRTGKRVVMNTIADCVVKNSRIHDEWLVRDNLALVEQLGFDPHAIARGMAAARREDDFEEWRAKEIARLSSAVQSAPGQGIPPPERDPEAFAAAVLSRCWSSGRTEKQEDPYAPYAVLHDSRNIVSGSTGIRTHYGALRGSFANARITADHVCLQPAGESVLDMAVRWAFAGSHAGPFAGAPASDAEVLILGITHWRLVAGHIVAEWTVFDKLAVLAQMYRPAG